MKIEYSVKIGRLKYFSPDTVCTDFLRLFSPEAVDDIFLEAVLKISLDGTLFGVVGISALYLPSPSELKVLHIKAHKYGT